MGLLFEESFDSYTTDADMLANWAVVGGFEPSTDVLQDGAKVVKGSFSGAATLKSNPFSPNTTTCITKFWFRVTSLGDNNFTSFLEIREGGTLHIELALTSSGTLKIYNSGSGLLGTSAAVISVNTWYYVETSVTLHDSLGSYDILIDSVNVLSGSGVDTQNGGTGQWDTVALKAATARVQYYDSVRILDSPETTFSIPMGSMSFTGLAPSFTIPIQIAVPVGSLTYSGNAPTIQNTRLISPGVGSVLLIGNTPTILGHPLDGGVSSGLMIGSGTSTFFSFIG